MYPITAQQRGEPTARRLIVHALCLVALLAGTAGTAIAGSDERKGTGGAHELRLPVGPRGTALGGAAVGDTRGVEAIFWNPAGLADLEGTEAMFSNTRYFADMDVNFAAIATRVGDFGTLGLNVKALSIGEVFVTTEAAPEGTGEVLEPTFTVLGVSYARQFTDRVLFGGTANFINERIANATANGLAFDFGVQYLTGWNGLRFGVVMKNFGGSMRFDGEDFSFPAPVPGANPTADPRNVRSSSAAFELPSHFTLSATYDLLRNQDHHFKAMGAFQNNNFIGDNLCGGLEWMYRDYFALRGSWMGSVTSEFDATTGDEEVQFRSGDDLYNGVALGAGFNVTAGQTRLGVDVAWRPVRDFFDDTLEFGLKVKF